MLSSKSTTSEYLHRMFATHGLNLLPEVELNSNDLLMDLARIGLGIALYSGLYAKPRRFTETNSSCRSTPPQTACPRSA